MNCTTPLGPTVASEAVMATEGSVVVWPLTSPCFGPQAGLAVGVVAGRGWTGPGLALTEGLLTEGETRLGIEEWGKEEP